MAAEAAAQQFPAGWYGKIPAAGDFLARRLPAAFAEAWHRWAQTALEGSRRRLAAGWRDDFLSMPLWRFVFSPGLLVDDALAGVMLPSVDAVGRAFPLTVAAALPAMDLDVVATLFAAQSWFDAIEDAALPALTASLDTSSLDAAIAARPFRGQWLRDRERRGDAMRSSTPRMLSVALGDQSEHNGPPLRRLAERLSTPCAAWLARPSEIFGRALLLCEALPTAEQVCAMMNGRWLAHGWICPSR
jgi:type VI secretion system protein ImpM